MNKILIVITMVLLAILFWLLDWLYSNKYLLLVFWSLLGLTVVYLLFKGLLEWLIVKRIMDSRTRYSIRKTISILNILATIVLLAYIWIENTQSLALSLGLVAAGVAIALQDIFKNFAGGILIFVSAVYRVGDRVEVSGVYGDVIDISIMNTTLLELREWVAADQATGRLATIPNGHALGSVIVNYTSDHEFIWDEITIPITYDSDWNKAVTTFMEVIRVETDEIIQHASKDMESLGEKYYFEKRAVEPAVFLTMTDNWLEFKVRYVTTTRQRRVVHDAITRLLLEAIQADEDIRLASATMDITAFPEVSLRQGEK